MNLVLYSKFSPSSKKVLQSLPLELNIKMLCVDNDEVRAILNSAGSPIKHVPCLLVFTDSSIYQHDGCDEIFRAFEKLRPQLPPPQMTSVMPPSQEMMQSSIGSDGVQISSAPSILQQTSFNPLEESPMENPMMRKVGSKSIAEIAAEMQQGREDLFQK